MFGHAIDYEVRGEAGKKTVVLVHGIAGDRAILVESCDAALAARGLRRVYVDLPGHGQSRGNPGAASADHLVGALCALVAAACPSPPLVVGYSYGAYLAQGLARDVVLAGMFLACPVVEADLGKRTRPARRVIERSASLDFGGDEHERETFEEVVVAQTDEVLARYRRVISPASRATDRAFVDAVRAEYAMARPYMSALANFAGPVSIACGRNDHWVGFEDALRLVRALPDAAFSVVPRAGHLLPIERPAAFRALLDEWLDRAIPTGAVDAAVDPPKGPTG